MTKMMTLAAIAALITAPLAMAQGGPNTAPQGGPNGSSQGGKPPADPEKCRKLEPTIRKQAEACLKIKKPEERGKCFEKIGKTVEPTGCGPFFEPLKQEYMSKEREKYPDQPSAIEGGGGQGGSH